MTWRKYNFRVLRHSYSMPLFDEAWIFKVTNCSNRSTFHFPGHTDFLYALSQHEY